MDLTNIEPARAFLQRIIALPEQSLQSEKPSWLQWFPPQSIEWNRLDLPLTDWPAGLHAMRIVHLSDLHLRRTWPAAMDALLERIRHDPPDLLLITGDFVDNKRNHRPAMPNVRRLVEGLPDSSACFAVHGNHDNYAIGRELKGSRLTFLDGVRQVAQTPRGPVELIGLPGKDRRELTAELLQSFPARQSALPRIILSHYPDHLRHTGPLQADLFLAGHTHGGQVCFSSGRPIISHDALPHRLCKGAHRVGRTWLVVSRGLGYSGLPIRTHCPPEAIEIHCRSASAAGTIVS